MCMNSTVINLYVCAFQTSFADKTAMFITNIVYVCAFMAQIFLMCVFGQELVSEYNLLSNQFYNSSWSEIVLASKYDDSKNCHKILTIFSIMLQADKNILIGKVFPLHLKTFTSVSLSFCLKCFFLSFANLHVFTLIPYEITFRLKSGFERGLPTFYNT